MTYRRLLMLAMPVLAGCYIYQPSTGVPGPIGRSVRLTLTDSGTANLAAQVGPSTEAVAGRLVDDSAGNYLVSMLGTRHRNGVETGWNGERVAVPRPLVARVEERRFSRRRTILMSAAVVLGTIVARDAFWGSGGSWASSGLPGRGPVPE